MGTAIYAQTWNEVSVPTQERLNDIQFVNNQVGYIAGENGTLMKTSNGGASWSEIVVQGISNPWNQGNFIDIEFTDATNGFLIVENAPSVYQTNDGGTSWLEVTNQTTNQCFPNTVFAVSTDNIFTGGSDCFQGATINEWAQSAWSVKVVNYQTFDTQHLVTDLDFDGNLGLAAVNNEYILRSTDAGATWDTINSNIGNGNVLTSVFIGSNDTCYAGYNQFQGGFGILFSTDFGLTWQEDINSATFYYPAYYGFAESSDGKIYAASVPYNGNIGVIFTLINGNWNFESVDQPVYAMDSYGSDVTWAVGDSGYVVVNKDLVTLSTNENDEILRSEIEIFPNPAGQNVKWNCHDCRVHRVRVVDLCGKVVIAKDIKNEKELNIEELKNGSYTLELTMENTVIEKRFIKH